MFSSSPFALLLHTLPDEESFRGIFAFVLFAFVACFGAMRGKLFFLLANFSLDFATANVFTGSRPTPTGRK